MAYKPKTRYQSKRWPKAMRILVAAACAALLPGCASQAHGLSLQQQIDQAIQAGDHTLRLAPGEYRVADGL